MALCYKYRYFDIKSAMFSAIFMQLDLFKMPTSSSLQCLLVDAKYVSALISLELLLQLPLSYRWEVSISTLVIIFIIVHFHCISYWVFFCQKWWYHLDLVKTIILKKQISCFPFILSAPDLPFLRDALGTRVWVLAGHNLKNL